MSTTRERYLEWKNRSLLPQLPTEIWSHIFSYLEISDLYSIRLVSRLFHSCVNQHTKFWSCVTLDIDQCSTYLVPTNLLHHIRSSNLNLFTKSNIYSHCTIYLKEQPLINSQTKRRKYRLLNSYKDNEELEKKYPYLRCLSVYFHSLRSYEQLQLEFLLKERIRRLEFSYEFLSNEPSLHFLFKLQRLKHLKISFLHSINDIDQFSMMLSNKMADIILLLLKLKRLKTLTLHNLHLVQVFPDNICFIEHLRSIWLEGCINIHFLLSAIDKRHLKNIVFRRSTCDRATLTSFLNQLDTLRYLDISSLQIIKSSNHADEQINIPPKLKTCSLNNTILQICSFLPHLSLLALEVIDINTKLLSTILATFQSLQILCLFFTTQNSSLSSVLKYLEQHSDSKLLIHLHSQSLDTEQYSLPSNILIIPVTKSLSCFCYHNII